MSDGGIGKFNRVLGQRGQSPGTGQEEKELRPRVAKLKQEARLGHTRTKSAGWGAAEPTAKKAKQKFDKLTGKTGDLTKLNKEQALRRRKAEGEEHFNDAGSKTSAEQLENAGSEEKGSTEQLRPKVKITMPEQPKELDFSKLPPSLPRLDSAMITRHFREHGSFGDGHSIEIETGNADEVIETVTVVSSPRPTSTTTTTTTTTTQSAPETEEPSGKQGARRQNASRPPNKPLPPLPTPRPEDRPTAGETPTSARQDAKPELPSLTTNKSEKSS
jgi:hypothetical protein